MSGYSRRRNFQERRSSRSPQDPNEPENHGTAYTFSPDVNLAVMEALDHIHIAMQYRSLGLCASCKRICVKRCVCGAFYCNSDCQRRHWPKHKATCLERRVGDLEEETGRETDEGRSPQKAHGILHEEEEEMAEKPSPFSRLTRRVDRRAVEGSWSEGEGSQSHSERRDGQSEGRRFGDVKQMQRGRGVSRRRPRTDGRYSERSSSFYKSERRRGDVSDLAEAEEWFGINERFILDSDSEEDDKVEVADRKLSGKGDEQVPGARKGVKKQAADKNEKKLPVEKDRKKMPAERGGKKLPAEKDNKKSSAEKDEEELVAVEDNEFSPDEKCGKSMQGIIELRKLPPEKFPASEDFLKKEVEVVATCKETMDRYWVMDVKNLKEYFDIEATLFEKVDEWPPMTPRPGIICACNQFNGEWARCKIVSMEPTLTVRLIDVGILRKCEKAKFRKLPKELEMKTPLAFFVEFDESLPEQYKSGSLVAHLFNIKWQRNTCDGVPIVTFRMKKTKEDEGEEMKALKRLAKKMLASQASIESKKKPVKDEKAASTARKLETTNTGNHRMISILEPTLTGMVMLFRSDSKIRYGSLIIERTSLIRECIEKVIHINGNTEDPISAVENDFVLVVDPNGHQQRGKVLNVFGSVYFVQLVDCGNIIPTDRVYRLPTGLETLPELGVQIRIEELTSPEEFKKHEICLFEVLMEYRPNRWLTALKNSEKEKIATVLFEMPPDGLDWEPKAVGLKSGSEVEITALAGPSEIYVRCAEGDADSEFLKMNMEVMEYAPTVPSYDHTPSVGDLCCARFEEDDCYYRCVVIAVPEGKVRVFFIDFGNEQETDIKDLKPLTESLEEYPMFATKVKLRNVSSDQWKSSVKSYAQKLSSGFTRMILTYEDSLHSGVILKEKKSGAVLNDYGNGSTEQAPAPKQDEDDLKS